MANELKHYGVVGMRWGIHKAKKYAADKNNYIRKKQNKEALRRYKSGSITGEQYIKARLKNRKAMYRKNQKVSDKLNELTPDKEKKIKSIYSKYKNEAIKTIPHYKLKKGAKKAGSLLLSLGTSSISVVTYKSIPIGLALNSAGKTATKFVTKEAIKTAADPIIDTVSDKVSNKLFNKKGAPKR